MPDDHGIRLRLVRIILVDAVFIVNSYRNLESETALFFELVFLMEHVYLVSYLFR